MSQASNMIDLGAIVAQAVEDKTKELQKELAEVKAENAKLESFVQQLKEMGQEYKDELGEAKAEVEMLKRKLRDCHDQYGVIRNQVVEVLEYIPQYKEAD